MSFDGHSVGAIRQAQHRVPAVGKRVHGFGGKVDDPHRVVIAGRG
jgi:hypothetical protein